MNVTRRTLGLGLLGVSAVVTGAIVLARSNPGLMGKVGLREQQTLKGFIGGEKEGFLANPKLVDFLRAEHGLTLDSIVAGSVEQCRELDLLNQKPNYLWPASEVLVDLAKKSGAPVRRDATILRSPIVFYSWEPVAKGLAAKGFVQSDNGVFYADTQKLIAAFVEGRTWADLGVPALAGKARAKCTDPNRSSSGMHFAGMVANALAGDVATAQSLAAHRATIVQLFNRMGYKTHSSKKLFEDYLSGGMGGAPLAVGYENQLVEWILEDPNRWSLVLKSAPYKPVAIYPSPTVVSTHALMSLAEPADDLIAALQHAKAQTIAWRDHGFRSSLGAAGAETNPLVAGRMPANLSAILPLPEADVLLSVLTDLQVRT